MRASHRLLPSLALVFALAPLATVLGCGGGGSNSLPVADMAVGVASPDLCSCGPPLDMAKPSLPTGAPCLADADCAAGGSPTKKPQCVRAIGTAMDMIQWPGGYCAAVCRMSLNDMNTGLNSDCADAAGTCEADPSSMIYGHCRFACNTSTDCRAGYACFYVNDVALACEPKAQSQCDPRKPKTCPANPPMGDAGAGFDDTCINSGDGTVGACYPGCDPFTVTGCPNTADAADCHISAQTGEGYCDLPNDAPAPAGGPCQYDTDCAPGYGCNVDTCWKYCHDDGKTVAQQCGVMGAICAKADPMGSLPASIAGICSKSN